MIDREEIEKWSDRRLTEHVAAGLRKVASLNPVGLVIANDFWTYSRRICGLPVYSIGHLFFTPWSDFECPFFPIFENIGMGTYTASSDFARGFAEYTFYEDRASEQHITKQTAGAATSAVPLSQEPA